MAFEVLITDQAFDNLDAITDFIKKSSSIEPARKWFASMIQAIETLKEMPARCPLTAESAAVGQEIRLLLHGRRHREYKIYFAIRYETPSSGSVRVFHIRHWARKALTAGQVRKLLRQAEQSTWISDSLKTDH